MFGALSLSAVSFLQADGAVALADDNTVGQSVEEDCEPAGVYQTGILLSASIGYRFSQNRFLIEGNEDGNVQPTEDDGTANGAPINFTKDDFSYSDKFNLNSFSGALSLAFMYTLNNLFMGIEAGVSFTTTKEKKLDPTGKDTEKEDKHSILNKLIYPDDDQANPAHDSIHVILPLELKQESCVPFIALILGFNYNSKLAFYGKLFLERLQFTGTFYDGKEAPGDGNVTLEQTRKKNIISYTPGVAAVIAYGITKNLIVTSELSYAFSTLSKDKTFNDIGITGSVTQGVGPIIQQDDQNYIPSATKLKQKRNSNNFGIKVAIQYLIPA